jgi:hypothetical protein
VGILVDFLKPWNFPDISQEYSLPAAESVILTSPDRVLHYDGTIGALVRILVDFLKALRFHQNQSILAALQPEFSSSSRILFTPHTTHASHPAYDPCKPLNPCKTAPQSEHSAKPHRKKGMTFAFVPSDQL